MLQLIKHANRLELKPSAELIALAKDRETTLADALEWHLCNGWLWVPPEDIGALTDGEIISDDGTIDDDGKWVPAGEPWHVYWFSNYMVENPIATWAEGRSVFFEKH